MDGYKLVPVDLLVRWEENLRTPAGRQEVLSSLQAMLAAAPASPQAAQPVAWETIEALAWGAFADGAKDYRGCTRERLQELRDVYTHADAGEVERLRAELTELKNDEPEWSEMQQRLGDENESLRAQLAERDAEQESVQNGARAMMRLAKTFLHALHHGVQPSFSGDEVKYFIAEAYKLDALAEKLQDALSTTAKPESDHE